MTLPKQSRGDRSRDQLLAGEYVLGVLSPEARRVVEERIGRDRGFAQMVIQWQRNLATLEEDYPLERLPPAISQSFLHPPSRRLYRGSFRQLAAQVWGSLFLWRSVALISLAALLTTLSA